MALVVVVDVLVYSCDRGLPLCGRALLGGPLALRLVVVDFQP